jgi:hypothetical protein
MKRLSIVVVLMVTACAVGWLLWPSIVVGSLCFADKKGEASGRRACDRIVAVGPRAIPAIIRSVKRNSPWVRRYCYLPIALGELGEPAHEALLAAIDSETDPGDRAKLASSLLKGFKDFSRVSVVIEDTQAGRINDHPLYMMAPLIRDAHTNAPPVLLENRQVNPQFATWWGENEGER